MQIRHLIFEVELTTLAKDFYLQIEMSDFKKIFKFFCFADAETCTSPVSFTPADHEIINTLLSLFRA